jgi:hypothetical protein
MTKQKALQILKYLQDRGMWFCWYDGVIVDQEYLQEIAGLI